MKHVIFDLDGTLTNFEHRLHYVLNRPKDYPAYDSRCGEDEPYQDMINVLNSINCNKLIWTGRKKETENITLRWLEYYEVHYDGLRMRPLGNKEPDHILKERWFKELQGEIICVFEDRQRVVDMWEKYGVRCVQVSHGKIVKIIG